MAVLLKPSKYVVTNKKVLREMLRYTEEDRKKDEKMREMSKKLMEHCVEDEVRIIYKR